MITFMEPKEKLKEPNNCLNPHLWHACAGSMVQMPPVNSRVFYFPQGHLEHASEYVDFQNLPRVPPYILCQVSSILFLAHPETDEVFVKVRLSPAAGLDEDCGPGGLIGPAENQEKPISFAKTLTQSDANNGGGFSVPRYCAETIFPRLDYSADPPVQTILAKDIHGQTWKFRHIYRGTPRRHLLTTGWNTFVNHKKLVAGDSIVFLRSEKGDLCVGIRRAKRGMGLSAFLRENEGKMGRNGREKVNRVLIGSRGRVKGEDVIEAIGRAVSGREFDVVYYPRGSTPEFFVRAGLVRTAMEVKWCTGMRFKMAFETEDSSRISWFMGTVAVVQPADLVRWPDSPWRLLQVAWDEPDLLHNVKRVSPWLVELVSTMLAIDLAPFSPPCKKLRLPGHRESPFDTRFLLLPPPFSGDPFGGSRILSHHSNSNDTPAGMQGARHAGYGSSLSADKMPAFERATQTGPARFRETGKSGDGKWVPFVLFGQKIFMENRVSVNSSSDTITSSSEGNGDQKGNWSDGSGPARFPSEMPQRSSCEGIRSEEPGVFME